MPKNWFFDGKITFGGYDLEKYAKKGLTEKDIVWWDLTHNKQYWIIEAKGLKEGSKYVFT